MTLQGIQPKQKFPGAIVADLREYAKKLGLPTDWPERVQIRTETYGTGSKWFVDYDGQPLAAYGLDILHEIEAKTHHVAIPPPPDPLVVASQLAVSQPADPQWRRFKHLTFRRDDVLFVNNVDDKGKENGIVLTICFRNGTTLLCGNEANYANSGMSTYEFFLQHVMQLAPEK